MMVTQGKILHFLSIDLQKSALYLEHMKTGTKMILGAAIVALLVAVIYYSQANKEAALVNNQEVATSTPVTSTPEGKKMAFSQLAKQEEATYKCSVNQYINGEETKGTVYLDKKLVRGEFTANYSGQKVNVTFIMRDGMTYVWNSKTPTQGFKLKSTTDIGAVAANIGVTGDIQGSPNSYLEQIGDYDCDDWIATEATFTIPTTVTFTAVN